MNRAEMNELNRVSELSEMYEALDNCVELERALGRLARADALSSADWRASKAQVHSICTRVEERLELDA